MRQMKTICVSEHDGLNERQFMIHITTSGPDDLESIKEAIKKACRDYIKTDVGKKTYEYNCESFNWADFEAHVPQNICRKYGFEFKSTPVSDYVVDWDEQLIDTTKDD